MSEVEVDCPRAKTYMTPCIARDGSLALSESGKRGQEPDICVGCGIDSRNALLALAGNFPPARRFKQTKDRAECANRLKEQVKLYLLSDAL